jgi:hypothetical protein
MAQTEKTATRGLNLWRDIAETQNDIIAEHGKIERNNPVLWGDYLHKWNNHDWLDVLHAVSTVQEQQPDLFKPYQERAFAEAARAIVNNHESHHRVLDTKDYKAEAWKAIMCLRELWNAIISDMSKPTELFEYK